MRRRTAALIALATAAPLAPLVLTNPAAAAPDGAVALTWQRIALSTIYPAKPVPVGTLYLAFTSRAVHKAVKVSLKQKGSSEDAAVAQAAHDVLVTYFPAAAATLDGRLAETLAEVPDGPGEARGVAIGARSAAAVVEDRADDGRDDASIQYTKPDGIGVWQPDSRGFLAPWLGFVDRIVGGRPAPVDGPDSVGSAAYRTDLAEVRSVGRSGADAANTATAQFFGGNPAAMYRDALITYLGSHPLGLLETTELFKDLDTSAAESLRQTWRLKYLVGFWRPVEAIRTDDEDPATTEEPGWTPVQVAPPYPDYPSGHQSVTASFTTVVACHLGDIGLTLVGSTSSRSYGNLEELRTDAFNARIWGGIHFRDAMDDARQIGQHVGQYVCRH